MKIALITDVHFGRIAHPGIVSALIRDVRSMKPDLVVFGGDLTQRARKHELRSAAALIRSLSPSIVIAGNHDVFAWWFPFRRLLTPLARYRQYISDDLNAEYIKDNVAILALNSSYGWTVKGGKFSAAQLAVAARFFKATAEAKTKILVVHHHLVELTAAFGKHDVARAGGELLRCALDWGVDAILCGHLHQSHSQIIAANGSSTVLVSSGTATSDRGRGADRNRNIYDVIDFGRTETRAHERVYNISTDQFEGGRVFSYHRTSDGTWVADSISAG